MEYLDTTLPVEQRVSYLLSVMTIEEKVAQITGIWVTDVIDPARNFMPDKAAVHIGNGIGHISRVGAASLLPPVKSAELANAIQRYLVEQTRLKIPTIVHEESCAGYLAKDATTFPQAIGLAATWEPELIQQMADVIRQQMRVVGAHHSLAPVLDVARDPRWGRMEETYGEDPYLITAIGNAYIRGLQSEDLRQGIIATAKHFLGYGWTEGGMNWSPAHIPERELREIFLTPFAAAIKEAAVASIMPAYHEQDGIPLHASRQYLVNVLRDELGFEGVFASDYFGVNMLMEYHHIAGTKAEAARMALEAGVDIELPGVDCYGKPLVDALHAGEIDIALVDACVTRVLKQKFDLGLFENPYVETGSILTVYNTPDQLDLSRTLAQKSIVLLKNEGNLLPLSKSLKSIAVIGPSADSARLMQGDYHYPGHLEGIFNPNVSLEAPTPGVKATGIDWNEHLPKSITSLEGIRSKLGSDTQIHYAKGCDITDTDTSDFAEAVEAAKQAEVAVVIVGDKSGLSAAIGATSGESIDSANLILPGVQHQLIEAIHATGTPTVVVLLTGRPYTLTWVVDHIPALLEAWFPAQQGGAALADVLFGDVNPGGKLPVSFPRSVGQLPVYYNHKSSGGRSHWQGQYIDESTQPLFPFGHGLSYTQFEYSDLQFSAAQVTAQDTLTITAKVKNIGQVAGDEVVQLYLHDLVASTTRP
ncbi:MAG TPA: glycoside hydrolase family 3 N-terminal domain-containing protein, partial [Phototrophicaceae bacterium]|nr:glycoside hydrolase family 3 N-terminal domain-containing protein [Phototrophicaceae bacterium]